MVMAKKGNLGWIFIKSLAIFFAILLVFAFAATYVNPAKFVWFAYFGMGFSILLVINILFAVFLGFNLKKTTLLPLVAIALNWSNIQTMMTFNSAEFDTNEKKVKVMSYNVNLFDYYQKINPKEKQSEQEILGLIADESPDIVCFQEFREDAKQASVTRFLAQHADLNYTSVSRYNEHIAFGNKRILYLLFF